MPEPLNRIANTFTSVPSGSTAIWLPCANTFWLPVIEIGADHVWPPSVVRENTG